LSHYYMFFVRKSILNISNYQLDRYFLEIAGASYGDKFVDLTGPDGFTRLQSGVFWWLINIRPGYLILRQEDTYTIEPYVPSHFARQFGYDQLYVGNPNAGLCFSENLFEGAWAWYYNVVGRTKTVFSLPHKTSNCHTCLIFYTWYSLASRMSDFGINTSCIKSIKASYETKLESNKRVRGMESIGWPRGKQEGKQEWSQGQ